MDGVNKTGTCFRFFGERNRELWFDSSFIKGGRIFKESGGFLMTEDHKYEMISATEFKSTNKSDVFFDKVLMKTLIKLRKRCCKGE